MLNTQRFLGIWVFGVCLHNLCCWICIIRWGLTRSNGVSQDCFISALILTNGWGDPVSQGQSSGQRFHGGLGTSPVLCWCIYCPLAPWVHLFIISSLSRRLSSISLCLWSNSRREPLMMSVVTTFTGHADFFVAPVDSSPTLSDCTYPGLFVVTFPNAHTVCSQAYRFLTFQSAIHCIAFSINPFTYKLNPV